MKYIEEKDLIKDKYYFVETYNGEFAVLHYYGLNHYPWGLDQTWGHVRYAFKEVENLEEEAKMFS